MTSILAESLGTLWSGRGKQKNKNKEKNGDKWEII